MAMSPFAVSLLGAETINRSRQGDQVDVEPVAPEAPPAAPEPRTMRAPRRATSYHNSFQTICSPTIDEPPSYRRATTPTAPRPYNVGKDVLPKYTCTVGIEAKVLLHLESLNPLHAPSDCEWREVYLVLRGTLLSFHRPKDGGAGKLLRSYTLQHAEIGLAADTQHAVLVPQTRLANLIPSAARRKAWQKDPGLFRSVRQHILRLRAETDQILLADASEDQVHSLIYAIGAGIDISHAIDERSIPRQCTVPRRRRRQRPANPGDLTDPTLLAEQERILRDMYPAFAERARRAPAGLERTTSAPGDEMPAEVARAPIREEDDLDLAMMREDPETASPPSPSQQDQTPNGLRQTAGSQLDLAYSTDMMYATSSTNFASASGKWQPPHLRTQQQVQRYVRRCMPVLLANAVRASDVLICNGKRVKINWRMQLLEEWELRPPSYKSHGFADDPTAERATSISQFSAAGSAAQDGNAQASTSVLGGEGEDQDQITPVETGLATLDLAKVTSIASLDKRSPVVETAVAAAKTREENHSGAESYGVVLCF